MRRILEMIRQAPAAGPLPSAAMMARELEVSWHTIIRDLNMLRDDEGAPIAYDASRKGFVLEDRQWTLPPVTLNQREVFAFSVAAKMLQPFRGTPLEMDLQSLFSKIERSLEGKVTFSADALTENITILGEDYVPLNRERWVEVAGLIERGATIRMRYRNFAGAEKSYIVAPVHMVAYHGNWYVLAFAAGKDRPATFALSRILDLAPTSEVVAVKRPFVPGDFLGAAFGITGGEKEIKVQLRFSPEVATYIAERLWHPSQRIARRRDGSVDLHMKTRGWKELVRWVLSWQPDVKIIAPRALQQRVRAKLKTGLRRA
jgi:predicted DNA-binding transcriptional regulator YafY